MLLLTALLIRIEEGLKHVDVVRRDPNEKKRPLLGRSKGRRINGQSSDP
jgi:hypothetical protein